MLKLLIITDDFTGALDTGIQFTKQGIPIQIAVEQRPDHISVSESTQVLVIDVETRPLTGEQSYKVISNVMRWAKKQKIEFIYKKTDSALRGNVGAELKAVSDACEKCIYFIPAFPKIKRVTKNGVHYINGVPLSESAFGKDPFEPVFHSDIKSILTQEYQMPVYCIGKEIQEKEYLTSMTQGVVVFDAETEEDMKKRLYELRENNAIHLLAGCSGLAEFLPQVLSLKGNTEKTYEKKRGLYIACGSLNPITKEQLKYACENGFVRINLTAEQKLIPEYYETEEGKQFLKKVKETCCQNSRVIVDTFDLKAQETEKLANKQKISKEQMRFAITKCHGKIVKYLIEQGIDYTIFMTGGDTLMGLMKSLNNPELIPVCEVSQGVVLSILKWNGKNLQVVSKSGGFGNKEVFIETGKKLIQQ